MLAGCTCAAPQCRWWWLIIIIILLKFPCVNINIAGIIAMCAVNFIFFTCVFSVLLWFCCCSPCCCCCCCCFGGGGYCSSSSYWENVRGREGEWIREKKRRKAKHNLNVVIWEAIIHHLLISFLLMIFCNARRRFTWFEFSAWTLAVFFPLHFSLTCMLHCFFFNYFSMLVGNLFKIKEEK